MMTLPLTRFGNSVQSVFALAGENENSATSAVGWALAQCPSFIRQLMDDVMPGAKSSALRIDLQRHSDDLGFTDIELRGHELHVIIEAKIGLVLVVVPNRVNLAFGARFCRRLDPRWE